MLLCWLAVAHNLNRLAALVRLQLAWVGRIQGWLGVLQPVPPAAVEERGLLRVSPSITEAPLARGLPDVLTTFERMRDEHRLPTSGRRARARELGARTRISY